MKKILFILPICTMGIISISNANISKKLVVNKLLSNANNQANDDFDECTFMYVGKDVAEDGLAIVARTGDTGNPLTYHNVKRYEKDCFANQKFKGINNFEWQLPEHTYAYTGFPRNIIMNKSLHWDASTFNECGLGISATLTCYTNQSALTADPFSPTGISEDTISGLLAQTCSTAKEAIQYLAKVIDTNGSSEANAIMAIDKNEAWYMELYTGHQYCAIKLPDNKVCTIGNEFTLNTLKDFDDENIIRSEKLFSLPKKNGFAKFEGEEQDKNMHLFNTYARPLSSEGEERYTTDASHMRTWRGRSLFAKEEEKIDYDSSQKYDPFFTPAKKLNNDDVFFFFRDSFDDILVNEDSKYDIFREEKDKGLLRCVATETSYQVHAIKVHPNLPNEMAIECWVAMGNSASSPFVPFNNSMSKFAPAYEKEINSYIGDEESALFKFRRINAIANTNYKNYSFPIRNYWNRWSKIWNEQYNSCINKALELIKKNQNNNAQKLLNNMLYSIQVQAINEADYLYLDLLAKYIQEQKSFKETITDFVPKTNIENYAKLYGYKFKVIDGKISLTKNDKTIIISIPDGHAFIKGKISTLDKEDDIEINIEKDKYYGNMELLNNYLAKDDSLAPIDFNSIIGNSNPFIVLAWVIPLCSIVLVGAIVGYIIIKKKLKTVNTSSSNNHNK